MSPSGDPDTPPRARVREAETAEYIPSEVRQQTAAAGLAWRQDEGFGLHYARTLKVWREHFETAWNEIAALGFDQRFRRLWTYYLAYCEAGFRTGRIDVRQVALTA